MFYKKNIKGLSHFQILELTNDLFTKVQILKLKDVIVSSYILLAHNVINNNLPHDVKEKFQYS